MHIDELSPGPTAEILKTIRMSAIRFTTTGTPQCKEQEHDLQPLIRAEQDRRVALPPKVSETSPKTALENLHQKALAPNVGF